MEWWQKQALELGLDLNFSTSWVPTYEPQQWVSTTMGNGQVIKVPISQEYLATAESAEHLRQMYCPLGKVVEQPFLGAGGPSSGYPSVRLLEWPPFIKGGQSVRILAGLLAVWWTRYPNDSAAADKACKAVIAASV